MNVRILSCLLRLVCLQGLLLILSPSSARANKTVIEILKLSDEGPIPAGAEKSRVWLYPFSSSAFYRLLRAKRIPPNAKTGDFFNITAANSRIAFMGSAGDMFSHYPETNLWFTDRRLK